MTNRSPVIGKDIKTFISIAEEICKAKLRLEYIILLEYSKLGVTKKII